MTARILPFLVLAVLISTTCCAAAGHASLEQSVVEIYTQYQRYDVNSPWEKQAPRDFWGYACVIDDHYLLTTANIIEDHTYIGAKKCGRSTRYPARLVLVDYDVDLAILTVDDPVFFSDLKPVVIDPRISMDQAVHFVVVGEDEGLRLIPGRIIRIAVGKYRFGLEAYLEYRAAVNFEGIRGGRSEPVFSSEKLVGLASAYSSGKQYAKIIPGSVITHFLNGVRQGKNPVFPADSFTYARLRSPVDKKYLKLPKERDGVYISRIRPGSSADGILKRGDVLMSVDGSNINWKGYYLDKDWGYLKLSDLMTRYHYPGDTIPIGVLRDGREISLDMPLKTFGQECYLIPEITADQQPQFIIIGGLVIQELTKRYLKSSGDDWKHKANKKFLYYYNYKQRYQRPDRERIVFLSRVLPDEVNIGYHNIRELVLTHVNDRPISRLEDVAAALTTPIGGFHKIKFEEYGLEIVLDAKKVKEADARIAKNYGIDLLQHLDKPPRPRR